MKAALSLVYLLAPLALCDGDGSIYIDAACGQQEEATIREAIKIVYQRAHGTIMFLEGQLEPDPRMDVIRSHLLDARQEKEDEVKRVLKNIEDMQQAEVRTLTPATNPRPGRSDVVIHCDHQRIDSSTPDQFGNPFDPTQGRYIAKDGLINSRECRQGTGDGDMSTRAVVSKPGAIMDLEPPSTHHDDYDAKGFQPEVLQLCADTMRFIRDPTKNHYLLSKDIIEQAVADGRNKDESTDEVRGIDLLPTLEHVLLHEFSHLIRAGYTTDKVDEEDPESDDCYGWTPAGACKNPRHADTIAYIALTVELRYNDIWVPNYSVTEKGTIVTIPEPRPPPPEQPAKPEDLPA